MGHLSIGFGSAQGSTESYLGGLCSLCAVLCIRGDCRLFGILSVFEVEPKGDLGCSTKWGLAIYVYCEGYELWRIKDKFFRGF